MGATNQNNPNPKPKKPREKILPLSPHGHTARFLFLMLEQCDLKKVNWQQVADGVGIPKGLAARSRYARFKKGIESQILGDAIQVKREKEVKEEMGLLQQGPSPRDSGPGLPGTSRKRGREVDQDDDNDEDEDSDDDKKRIKLESATLVKKEPRSGFYTISDDDDNDDEENDSNFTSSLLPRSPLIKVEPGRDPSNPTTSNLPRSPLANTVVKTHRPSFAHFLTDGPHRVATMVSRRVPNPNSSFYKPNISLPLATNTATTTAPTISTASHPRPSTAAAPLLLRPRLGKYRSPWVATEVEEDQDDSLSVAASGASDRKENENNQARRSNSRENEKGSAKEPFSID